MMQHARVFVVLCSALVGCAAAPAPAPARTPIRLPPDADLRRPAASRAIEIPQPVDTPRALVVGAAQRGDASYYGEKFRGKKTASGEVFDPSAFTAAHRTLPFGTFVEVRRTDTGRAVVVRINDRGPFGSSRRVIDLAQRAALALDMLAQGVAPVELRVVAGP